MEYMKIARLGTTSKDFTLHLGGLHETFSEFTELIMLVRCLHITKNYPLIRQQIHCKVCLHRYALHHNTTTHRIPV